MKNIMSKIYLKKDVDSINKKINMLGNTRIDAVTFISLRILSTILFALFLVLFTNISYMFDGSEFNRDISSWNVSSVIDMHGMFGSS